MESRVSSRPDQGLAPSISWVSLAYQPKNVAPVVDDVVVEDPGIRADGISHAAAGSRQCARPRSCDIRAHSGSNPPPCRSRALIPRSSFKNEPPPQGIEQKGYQSVLWSAHDDNDDDLVFTVYFRGESENRTGAC